MMCPQFIRQQCVLSPQLNDAKKDFGLGHAEEENHDIIFLFEQAHWNKNDLSNLKILLNLKYFGLML